MHVADNARLENRKSSNGRKIARMARNLTIFGPKRSQRRKLIHEKFSNERNERKVPENSKLSKKFEKHLKTILENIEEMVNLILNSYTHLEFDHLNL